MMKKLFLLCSLVALTSACSGERNEEFGNECKVDADCSNGATCEKGYCEGASAVEPSVDSGGVTVEAAAEAVGGENLPAPSVETSQGCNDPKCVIEPGSTVTFHAADAPGYRFDKWTGNDPRCTGDDPNLTIMNVDADIKCVANYIKRVTVKGVGEGTSADSQAAYAQCAAATCEVDAGSKVVISAPAREGQRFTGFEGEGCSDVEGQTVTVTTGTSDVTCTAKYVATHGVTGAVAGAEGAVMAASDAAFAACEGAQCTVDEGSDVTLTAPTLPGHRFTGWSGEGCTGSDPVLTIHGVSGELTCTAGYVVTHSVTGSVLGVSEAAVNAHSEAPFASCAGAACSVDAGSAVTLSAPALEGYRFAGWSGSEGCVGNAADLTISDVQAELACVANYVQRFVVTLTQVGLAPGDATPSPLEASSPDEFGTCSGPSCAVDLGGSAVLRANTVPGYRLGSFSGEGCTNVNATAVTLSEVAKDITCVAHYVRGIAVAAEVVGFTPVHPVVITSVPAAVSCSNGACVVDSGSDVTIKAPTEDGRRFLGWSGDEGCTGTNLTITLRDVTTTKQCRANYSQRLTVSGVAAPAGAGSVAASATDPSRVCEGASCVVDAGQLVKLTVTAGTGRRFTGWSGGGQCTGASNPLTIVTDTTNVTCTANFVSLFTVSFPDPANGSITASNIPATATCTGVACTVDAGSALRLTAAANPSYRFTGWSGCSTSGNPVLDLANITANLTCTANFTRRYVVGFPDPAGGAVAASNGSASSVCTGTSCTVDAGSGLRLTATPDTGFRFASWSNCSTSTNPVLDLTNIASDLTCVANFVQRVTVAYNVAAGGGGTVSGPSPQCTSGSCTLDFGASVDITASASPGFRFGSWSGAGCSDSDTSTANIADLANIQGNVTCTANFVPRFTVGFADPANGAITASNIPATATCTGVACTVDGGSSLRLSAAADPNYRFTGWSGCSTSTNAVLDLANINADLTCTANFMRRFVVGFPDPAGGAVAASNGAATATCMGASCTVDAGTGLRLTANADTGFRFASWSNCSTSTNPVLDLTNIASDLTCVANFVPRFTVSFADPANGAITASNIPATATCTGVACTVDGGSSLRLSAAADPNYRFTGWSGCSTSTNAVLDLANINANLTCTANFMRRFVVGFPDPAGGAVAASNGAASATCTGASCTVDAGTGLRLTASADTGFRFTGWSNCSTSTNPILDLTNIASDLTCVANFVQRVTVTYNVAAGGGGTVSGPSPQCAGGTCTLDTGASVDITAAANDGFRFGSWSGTGCTDRDGSTPAVADLTNITTNVTCTANFVRQVTVTYNVAPAGAGTVTASSTPCPDGSPCTVDLGSDLAITAGANTGFRFNGWTGSNCNDSTPGTPSIANLAGISANVTCTANFVRQYSVSFSASPAAGGSITAGGACSGASPCTVDAGSTVTLTPNTSGLFTFSGWTGSNCVDAVPGTPNVMDLTVNANVSCQANFAHVRVTVAVARDPSNVFGTISVTPSGGSPACTGIGGINISCVVDAGTNVTLNATENGSGHFLGWGGPAVCQTLSPSHSFAVTTDTTCTASYYGLWSWAYGHTGTDYFIATHPIDRNTTLGVGTAPLDGTRLRLANVDAHTGALLEKSAAGAPAESLQYTSSGLQGMAVSGVGKDYLVLAQVQGTSPRPLFMSFGSTPWMREMKAGGPTTFDKLSMFHGKAYLASGYLSTVVASQSINVGRASMISPDGALLFDTQVCAPMSCGKPDCYSTQARGAVELGDNIAVVHNVEVTGAAAAAYTFPWITLYQDNGRPFLRNDRHLERRIYMGTRDTEITHAVALPDAEMLAVGRTIEDDNTNFDVFAVKLDRDLNVLFARVFEHKGAQDSLTSVTVSPRGDEYWLAGYTTRTDVDGHAADGLTIRLDKSGEVLSELAYGGANNDMFMDVRPAFDGGYLLAGVSSDGRPLDGWVLRVDDDGLITFNAASGMTLAKLDYPARDLGLDFAEIGCSNGGAAGSALSTATPPAAQLVAPARSVSQAP